MVSATDDTTEKCISTACHEYDIVHEGDQGRCRFADDVIDVRTVTPVQIVNYVRLQIQRCQGSIILLKILQQGLTSV